MPEKPINTPEWASRFKFDTFGDPKLEAMVQAAAMFHMESSIKGAHPRWLTFCGPSGTGKTHLASALFKSLEQRFSYHPSLICGADTHTWQRLLSKLRQGDSYDLMDNIRDANLYFLDDFGTERPTEFALEKLYEIIEARNRKWTILTSNLSVQQIAKTVDTRISSRLIRNNSIVVEVDAPDYSLRTKPQPQH